MRRSWSGRWIFLWSWLLAGACVQPLALPEIGSNGYFFVDGLLTQERVVVRMYGSADSLQAPLMPITDAAVTIFSDQGELMQLELQLDGSYQSGTNTWQGELNERYWLRIDRRDGRVYESDRQQLKIAGLIDRTEVLFRPNYFRDAETTPHAMEVRITATKPINQPLLRWRWTGTYQVLTYPERIPIRVNMFGQVIQEPPPCAVSSTCTCCQCWVTEQNSQPLLARPTSGPGESETKVIALLPVDAHRFSERYRLEIEQLSLDVNSYRFWQQVEAQMQAQTNLFQPAVLRLQGNIRNVADPSEVVLGLFTVSGVSRVVIDIDPLQVPNGFRMREEILQDCRLAFRNSKNVKPLFW
jgi:hypothetical protein